MAGRKRIRDVVSTARGLCRLLLLRRVRRRRAPPPPPSSPSASSSASSSSSSTSSEAIGARPFYPRPLIRGTRSINQRKPWKCDACGSVNEPIHHLVFDLPPLKCTKCDADPPEGLADFGFCYGDLGVNGFCPIGNVKDQEGPTCLANAFSSAVEITQRITRIILEEPLSKEGPLVDVNDLLDKYKSWCVENCETNADFDVRSLIAMLVLLKVDGVRDKESNELYNIYDWDYIDEHDFAAISSALADGYPLVTGFLTGKRVVLLEPGEVYTPPMEGSVSKDGEKPIGHMVLLVGAQQEGKEKFLYFLSSWSKEFCFRINGEGDGILGGIGAVTADGIDFSPVQILRFDERRKQEVQHPRYPNL